MRRSLQRQRRASWTIGVTPKRRQVADFQLGRRNTGIPETLTQSFSTPPSHTPTTPKSASSLTDIDEGGPPAEQRFKFPNKRRATVGAVVMSKSRSSPGVPSTLSPVPNGAPNGHLRTRHLSTGSSNQSDDPELSIGDITASSNFFDFDENADDLYMAPPEEYIHNMRIKEKIRGRFVLTFSSPLSLSLSFSLSLSLSLCMWVLSSVYCVFAAFKIASTSVFVWECW